MEADNLESYPVQFVKGVLEGETVFCVVLEVPERIHMGIIFKRNGSWVFNGATGPMDWSFDATDLRSIADKLDQLNAV